MKIECMREEKKREKERRGKKCGKWRTEYMNNCGREEGWIECRKMKKKMFKRREKMWKRRR